MVGLGGLWLGWVGTRARLVELPRGLRQAGDGAGAGRLWCRCVGVWVCVGGGGRGGGSAFWGCAAPWDQNDGSTSYLDGFQKVSILWAMRSLLPCPSTPSIREM